MRMRHRHSVGKAEKFRVAGGRPLLLRFHVGSGEGKSVRPSNPLP